MCMTWFSAINLLDWLTDWLKLICKFTFHKREVTCSTTATRTVENTSFAVELVTQTTIWRSSRFSHDSTLILFHPEPHQSMSSGYSDRASEPIRRRLLHNAREAWCDLDVRTGCSSAGMSESWWLIIGRGKSRRVLVSASVRSRIGRDAISNTQHSCRPPEFVYRLQRRRETQQTKERKREREKENEAAIVEERQHPGDGQMDGRPGRADSAR